MKKLTSILLVLAIVFSLTACKKEEPPVQIDFNTWFNNEVVIAYDAFIKTENGQSAPFNNISDMLISDRYIKSIFNYISTKAQPEDGEITESNGMYIYQGQTFKQTFEFNKDTCSVRITSTTVINAESRPQFTVTIREKDDVYYIQYLASEFRTYYEISFTATNGSSKAGTKTDLPYSIFDEEIPEMFAKES